MVRPPPPPPPDVPELDEDHEKITGTTLRERLEQHREDPSCANCHAKMDPIGFAMENYDAIGNIEQRMENLILIPPVNSLMALLSQELMI